MHSKPARLASNLCGILLARADCCRQFSFDPQRATNDTNETLAKDRPDACTRTSDSLGLKPLAKFVERVQSRVRQAIRRRQFAARISRLRGGIDLAQARYLRALIGECKFGARIEVGSYRGKSAVALSAGLPTTGVNGTPMLYCVEPHKPFTGFYGGQFGPEDRGAFYRAMLKTGAFRRVALINLSSEVVAVGWRESIGFLFIDGDHTYEGVNRDFESWKSHLLAGAIVAFDDSLDPNCGPHRLIGELLAADEYETLSSCGKITTLRRSYWRGVPPLPEPDRPLRILVICHRAVVTGGLLRFERAGREMQKLGHEICFCTLSDELPESWSGVVPVRRFSDAWREQWDVTMCPGAGFLRSVPAEILSCFRDPRFGLRMQHVLSDRSRRDAFLRVNEHFSPHTVIFNNADWEIGTFTDFKGNSFHHLIGACDSTQFKPGPERTDPREVFVIGGQTRKNAAALIAALRALPPRFVLRLFGPADIVRHGNEDLIVEKRLQLTGELFDGDLAAYYRELDCFVSPEQQAGWSNATAEAMASGVPVICTRHGTTAFAADGVNALILAEAAPAEIAASILKLESSPQTRERLAVSARESIARFDWQNYAQELLALCRTGRDSQYFHLPQSGLHGKWPPEARLTGLETLLTKVRGCTVLDLGAAEGWIARSMLEAGARIVHGFELDESRVRTAAALCADYPGAQFRQADLSDWKSLRTRHSDVLLDSYDIVLYLGIHHHLAPQARCKTLAAAASLANAFFAIRTSPALYAADAIAPTLENAGFRLIESQPDNAANLLGGFWLFERVSRPS
jgi:glycosyltransferase involved in cell wall biosynthesis